MLKKVVFFTLALISFNTSAAKFRIRFLPYAEYVRGLSAEEAKLLREVFNEYKVIDPIGTDMTELNNFFEALAQTTKKPGDMT